MATRRRLGWLGPAIVLVGLAVGGYGIYYIRTARPVPGAEIDRIPLAGTPNAAVCVIRQEQGGEHSFIEVWDGDQLRWTQFIPHYAGRAGRSAIGWAGNTLAVRVERDGRQELWAFGLPDGSKGGTLFLAPEHEPIPAQMSLEQPGQEQLALTYHDAERVYELVSGPTFNQLVGIDVKLGKALWKIELGKEAITRIAQDGGQMDLWQGDEHRRILPLSGKWYYPDPMGSKPQNWHHL